MGLKLITDVTHFFEGTVGAIRPEGASLSDKPQRVAPTA